MGIKKNLAQMIVKDLQPLSLVEYNGFRDFVKTLDHSYNIPHGGHLIREKNPSIIWRVSLKSKRKSLDVTNTVLSPWYKHNRDTQRNSEAAQVSRKQTDKISRNKVELLSTCLINYLGKMIMTIQILNFHSNLSIDDALTS